MRILWGISVAMGLLSLLSLEAAGVAPAPDWRREEMRVGALTRAASGRVGLDFLDNREELVPIVPGGDAYASKSSSDAVSEGSTEDKMAWQNAAFDAAFEGNIDLLRQCILEKKVRLNTEYVIKGNNVGLMDVALLGDQPGVIDFLSRQGMRLLPDYYNNALVNGYTRVVKWWIENGYRRDGSDASSFLTVVHYGHEALVKFFVEDRLVPVGAQVRDSKRTALHLAVAQSQEEVVKYLVRMGGYLEAMDSYGLRPIDIARVLVTTGSTDHALHNRRMRILEFLTGKMASCCACGVQ